MEFDFENSKYGAIKEGKYFRIYAKKDFGEVKKGEKGGLIQKGGNLSKYGNSWVSDNALVSENAWASENSLVSDNALVSGTVRVFGNARVSRDSRVSGNIWVFGDTLVSGVDWCSVDVLVHRDSCISNDKDEIINLKEALIKAKEETSKWEKKAVRALKELAISDIKIRKEKN